MTSLTVQAKGRLLQEAQRLRLRHFIDAAGEIGYWAAQREEPTDVCVARPEDLLEAAGRSASEIEPEAVYRFTVRGK